MEKNSIRFKVIVLILVLLLPIGCTPPEEQVAISTECNATDQISTETTPTGEWFEIHGLNPKMKYKIFVPPGWQVVDFSDELPTAQFIKACSPTDIKLDSPFFSLSIAGENLTPEEVLRTFVKEGDGVEVTETTLGGLPAWSFESESMDSKIWNIVAAEKGRIIQLYTSPAEFSEDTDLKSILESIQFDIQE